MPEQRLELISTIDARRGEETPGPVPLVLDFDVISTVRSIIEAVRDRGDDALVELTRRYDGVDIDGRIQVDREELEAATAELPEELRSALDAMAERVRALHERQLGTGDEVEEGGIRSGVVRHPIASAGCYVPGGRAAYPSTVLMTAVPARVAGVGRVVVCTPPSPDGSIPASVRYAARLADVDAVYRIGGAHAVAALAFGTTTVGAVDKIVGPGNIWVTAAKREVVGAVGIDGLEGPSELVVIADETADPALLAVDLIAQAEHDPLARAILVTTSEEVAERTLRALADELQTASRTEIIRSALMTGAIVLVEDEEAAARAVDRVAPEHLEVMTADPRAFLGRVSRFGAAFLGPSTAVSLGDYGVGSNHVLPTMGTARFASGLRTEDFITASYVVQASREGVERVGAGVEAIARAEGLHGHARASEVRRGL